MYAKPFYWMTDIFQVLVMCMLKWHEAERSALLAAFMPSKGDGAALTPFDRIAPMGNCGNNIRE